MDKDRGHPFFRNHTLKTRTTLMVVIAFSFANGTILELDDATFNWIIDGATIQESDLARFLLVGLIYFAGSFLVLGLNDMRDHGSYDYFRASRTDLITLFLAREFQQYYLPLLLASFALIKNIWTAFF